MRFLQQLRLSRKLAVMLLIPTLGLMWFAHVEMRLLTALRSQSRNAVELAELSADLATLMHETQRERGLASGYLSESDEWFQDAYAAQQAKTDAIIAALGTRIERSGSTYGTSLQARLNDLIRAIEAIEGQRARIAAREPGLAEAIGYYNNLNERTLDIIGLMSGLSLDEAFRNDVAAFVSFLRGKEYAGIERAILTAIFADDVFDPGAYERFREMIAAQDIYFRMFERQAHAKHLAYYRDQLQDPSVAQAARMRRIALNNAQIGNFGVDPQHWYGMQTQKINQLYKVEERLAADLALDARNSFDRVTARLTVSSLSIMVVILLATLFAVWMTRIILRQLGADPTELFQMVNAIADRSTESGGAGQTMQQTIRKERALSLATVLHDTQQELSRSIKALQRLATAVESAAEGVVILDADARIEYVNTAFLRYTQFTAEEIIGRRPGEIATQDPDPRIISDLRTAMAAGKPWSGILRIERRDGRLHDEEHTVSPIRDPESGRVTNYVSIVRDVTERIQMERQLRQAQKLESIGQLAAGIAHEINTPTQYVSDNTVFLQRAFAGLMDAVAAGSTLLETTRTGHVDDDAIATAEAAFKKARLDFLQKQVPPAFEQSLEGLEQVSRIVGAMKEFSHPAQDKTGLDLNRAIQSTITVARNEWKYVAEMHTGFDESLPLVPCLPGEFNQVILNIIVNAAHAIGDVVGDGADGRGQITVTTRHAGDFAEVRITDTGAGMSEDVRARIFDAFFTTKEVGRGTGQGLAIAYNVIVEKHGGTIDVESAPGAGTTFIICLPLQAPIEAEHTEEAA